MLSLYFNLDQIHSTSDAQNEQKALNRYTKTINPVLDLAALTFGIPEIRTLTGQGFANLKTSTEQNVVEGALISIENDTGYITAIVGGSKYDESNQLIRAVQGNLQPGSAFKPLYYSAAIDSRKFTPATVISDLPIVFYNEDGTPYMPLNFLGKWNGSVLVFDALAQSMNVASIRVLDGIGFDAAIDRASSLLGYTDPDDIRRRFPRVYPLGLGIISTSPLRMARAFSIFANLGREVTPISIRSVEDRNGRIILDIEREVRQEQRRKGNAIQVVSPQNAYVMISMLKKTVERPGGTLYNPSGWGSKFTFKDANGKTFKMPMAGKTGTPQNWSDAWTIGFSAYYTTAIWFGFDKPGNSLGLTLTGSTLAGPVWADYMREIHQGLPYRDFLRPATGLVDATVCIKSGLLKTSSCTDGEVTLTFLEGTQPMLFCEECGSNRGFETFRGGIELNTMFFDTLDFINDLKMPVLRDDALLREIQEEARRPQNSITTNRNTTLSTIEDLLASIQMPTLPEISTAPASNSPTPNTPVSNPPASNTTENNSHPVSETEPDEKESFIMGMDDDLEPPSYNPVLD
jgi:penicillin-binding protein 1A